MATRCNVMVSFEANRLMLYRHWDGYLAETGADLAQRLKAADFDALAFAKDLMFSKRGGEGFDKEQPQYELTGDLHGDIEYFYIVRFCNNGKLRIFVAKRPSDYPELDRWVDDKVSYSFEEFVAEVNKDRAECNGRIAQLRASSKAYADCSDYPMLEAA
jgi:hypothetical protein